MPNTKVRSQRSQEPGRVGDPTAGVVSIQPAPHSVARGILKKRVSALREQRTVVGFAICMSEKLKYGRTNK